MFVLKILALAVTPALMAMLVHLAGMSEGAEVSVFLYTFVIAVIGMFILEENDE